LPPVLVAFRGHVHGIDPSWHMLGLGYQEKTYIERVRRAAVIHYNGQCKPWLDIAFKNLRPFWTKYVNYSNTLLQIVIFWSPSMTRSELQQIVKHIMGYSLLGASLHTPMEATQSDPCQSGFQIPNILDYAKETHVMFCMKSKNV
jgi:lipopolysaccharide biosynthesis glycosyltransferase